MIRGNFGLSNAVLRKPMQRSVGGPTQLAATVLASACFRHVSWLRLVPAKRRYLSHKKLDEAVFAVYGWKSDLSDEEILEKLLSLNLERAKEIGGKYDPLS